LTSVDAFGATSCADLHRGAKYGTVIVAHSDINASIDHVDGAPRDGYFGFQRIGRGATDTRRWKERASAVMTLRQIDVSRGKRKRDVLVPGDIDMLSERSRNNCRDCVGGGVAEVNWRSEGVTAITATSEEYLLRTAYSLVPNQIHS